MDLEKALDRGEKFPPMGAIAIYLDSARATTRCAALVFSACILVLFAVWFYNRSIEENSATRAELLDRYNTLDEMLWKTRAYQSRDHSLFAQLAYQTLSQRLAPELKAKELGEGPVDQPLAKQIEQFGIQAERIFKESEKRDRSSRLDQAIQDSFREVSTQKLMRKVALPHLAKIDAPEEWNGIVDWIMSYDWPAPNGIRFRNLLPDVDDLSVESVADEHKYRWRFLIEDALRAPDGPTKAERLLESKWEETSGSIAQFESKWPKMAILGTGVSLQVHDLLMLAAPLIALLQLAFLLLCEREGRLRTQLCSGFAMHEVLELKSFPKFGCPNDPLQLPENIIQAAERAIYLLFLSLPPVILGCGIVTRYQFAHINFDPAHRSSWLDALSDGRSFDRFSSFLDYVTLACLAVSLLVCLRLTSSREEHQNARDGQVRLFIAAKLLPARVRYKWISALANSLPFLPLALCVVGCATSIIRAAGSRHYIGPSSTILLITEDHLPIALFGIVSAVFFSAAVRKRTKLTSMLSLMGVLLFLFLAFKR